DRVAGRRAAAADRAAFAGARRPSDPRRPSAVSRRPARCRTGLSQKGGLAAILASGLRDAFQRKAAQQFGLSTVICTPASAGLWSANAFSEMLQCPAPEIRSIKLSSSRRKPGPTSAVDTGFCRYDGSVRNDANLWSNILG